MIELTGKAQNVFVVDCFQVRECKLLPVTGNRWYESPINGPGDRKGNRFYPNSQVFTDKSEAVASAAENIQIEIVRLQECLTTLENM